MHVIVGLGNPGKEYENTRHNIGFDVVEAIAKRHGFTPFVKKFQGLFSEGHIEGEKVKLLMPQTFMNLSGRSVLELMQFYKVPLEKLIVIHDDLDLLLGKIRVKKGGSHGGHNGLRSIDGLLGLDYFRLRFGIGHPGMKSKVSSYVLGKFDKDEEDKREFLIEEISVNAGNLVREEYEPLMSRIAMNFAGQFKVAEPEPLKVD